MKTYLTICAALVPVAVPAAVAAQESVPAEVCEAFDLYVAIPDTLAPLLQEIKDQESADKAAEKLHQVLPNLYEARTVLNNLPQLSPAATQELERRYGKRAQEGWGAVYHEIFRLQKAQCFGSTALAREFNILCMMLQ